MCRGGWGREVTGLLLPVKEMGRMRHADASTLLRTGGNTGAPGAGVLLPLAAELIVGVRLRQFVRRCLQAVHTVAKQARLGLALRKHCSRGSGATHVQGRCCC